MLTFPSLRNPSKIKRTVMWRSLAHEATSGKRSNVALYPYPRRRYTITYDVLFATDPNFDWRLIEGFYNLVNGPGILFAYTDYWDNTVTNMPFAVGNGVTTSFQLTRTMGGYAEPVSLIVGTPIITGTAIGFTVGPTGLVTFSSPPASGPTLSWTGSYNWPCRFDDDNFDFENMIDSYFQLGGLSFSTEKIV